MAERIPERSGISRTDLAPLLGTLTTPLVFRGLVADWPLVQAARQSDDAAMDFLGDFDAGHPLQAQVAPPETRGRFFYNEDLTGFNFRPERVALPAVLATLRRLSTTDAAPSVYVGSTTLETHLPGLRERLPMPAVPADALASIWLGNRSRIAAHHDVPDNLACVVAGRRRFTLFAPEQVANLYIGPLDFTPAGQAISLVDFAAPDFDRFPRFASALEAAWSAELEPGDALFIPSLWWHHIEGLTAFNVMVNFWWRASPDWLEAPMNALMLALISLRELPAHQRAGWEALFRHYVFGPEPERNGHIPEHARRVLGSLDARQVRELRSRLRERLTP